MSDMKKQYQKPLLAVESFELTQSVAASCGAGSVSAWYGKPTHSDAGPCQWDLGGGVTIFNAGACSIPAIADEQGHVADIFCYNNPGDAIVVFGS